MAIKPSRNEDQKGVRPEFGIVEANTVTDRNYISQLERQTQRPNPKDVRDEAEATLKLLNVELPRELAQQVNKKMVEGGQQIKVR